MTFSFQLDNGKTMTDDRSADKLLKRRDRAVASVPNLAEVLRGTLRERYVRCGKPGCHCQKGKGHGPFLYLSVSVGAGKTVQITIAFEDRGLAERYVRNYQRLQKLLEEVSDLNRELFHQRLLGKPQVQREELSARRSRPKKTK